MMRMNWKRHSESRRTTGHGESCREVRIRAEGCPVDIIVTDGSNYCTDSQQDVIVEFIVLALALAQQLTDKPGTVQ